jgi:Kdo2-lipid IVA lauroyltransferase/acyltransferase
MIPAMGIREAGHAMANVLPGLAAAVTSRVPLPVAETLGAKAGALMAVVPNRMRRRSLENLARAFPDHPASHRSELARRALAHAGREAGATVNWYGHANGELPSICSNYAEIAAAIERDRAAGRGTLWVGAHLGNPQLLSALCATLVPVTSVGTGYHFRRHLDFVAEGRQRLGLTCIPANAPPLELLRALQRNELVCFLPDVQPRRNNGVWLPFFGRPACTTLFPASLARLTGAVLRPAFLVREGERYRARLHEPLELPRNDEGDAGLERAMRAWSTALEQEVRRHPEQWIWMSRRWRPLPTGVDAGANAGADASANAGLMTGQAS